MLHELGVALPALRLYKTMAPINPIDPDFERSLSKSYTELVCFYARTMNFFKMNKHGMSRNLPLPCVTY